MELYEIKNGLDKAHLLIDEYKKSAHIDEKLREIEGPFISDNARWFLG